MREPGSSEPDGFERVDLFGKLSAQGVVDRVTAMGAILADLSAADHDGDWASLPGFVAWALDRAEAAWEMRRALMEQRIRRRLHPLIETGRCSADLLDAAEAENRADRRPLLTREVRFLIANELKWALRRSHGVRRVR